VIEIAWLYAVKQWFVGKLRRVEYVLVRRASSTMLTWTAVSVSVSAGVAMATGGLTRDYMWWLMVPPLTLVRLALARLSVDGGLCRAGG
jgi:hypothetical protein